MWFKKVNLIFGLCFAISCTTIDFIPEYDYSSSHPTYSKKSWEEVEIHYSRPDRRINIQGTVKIKDFEGTGRLQDYETYIKKEMFRRKMDGVWIEKMRLQSIHDPLVQTMDTRGNVTHTYESESVLRSWTGYAFRDR
jgi:hypothetical protein